MAEPMIDYHVDADGISTITWDMPGRAVNVINAQSLEEYAACVDRAIADRQVRGVIVTSSKPGFIAGADLEWLPHLDAQQMQAQGSRIRQLLRKMEIGGKPFVAAINGAALGGGFEICLACHHRIAAANPAVEVGLPEVQLGLLPGAGGTQRLPRMIGIRNALPLLLDGIKLRPREALEAGLVDAVAPEGELLSAARAWLLSPGAKAVQPWDAKGFRIPGGPPMGPAGMESIAAAIAMVRAKTMGLYPAPFEILSAVYEGCAVDIDTGLKIEERYFLHLFGTPETRNLIRLFFARVGLQKLAARPREFPTQAYTKIGVLGAGMMGAGIAYVCAHAGLEVVLLDTAPEIAERGKAYSAKLLDKRQVSGEARERFLARIRPTADFADLDGCELVVEAVFENFDLKGAVTRQAEAVLGPHAILASNTSTLPISGLARASARPENFIGMHFFSPVDRMPLVEIIVGKETSAECLARVMDLAAKVHKTPIVVNDSRGFYTSRVFGTYLNEGLAMLGEGIAPALIENAGRLAGMPLGPLALADEVSLDLQARIRAQAMAALGDAWRPPPGDHVLLAMVEQHGRLGKKIGQGFYDYPPGAKKSLWPGLAECFSVRSDPPEIAEIVRRFRYVQSLESVRCLEEGVVTDPRDADVGSVLGWSFCPALGGAIGHIETVGIARFTEECRLLEEAYGERFRVPALLRDMAESGASFYSASPGIISST